MCNCVNKEIVQVSGYSLLCACLIGRKILNISLRPASEGMWACEAESWRIAGYYSRTPKFSFQFRYAR